MSDLFRKKTQSQAGRIGPPLMQLNSLHPSRSRLRVQSALSLPTGTFTDSTYLRPKPSTGGSFWNKETKSDARAGSSSPERGFQSSPRDKSRSILISHRSNSTAPVSRPISGLSLQSPSVLTHNLSVQNQSSFTSIPKQYHVVKKTLLPGNSLSEDVSEKDDGFHVRLFPTHNPSSKYELNKLFETLCTMLNDIPNEDRYRRLEEEGCVLDTVFKEVVRQVSGYSTKRADLLTVLWARQSQLTALLPRTLQKMEKEIELEKKHSAQLEISYNKTLANLEEEARTREKQLLEYTERLEHALEKQKLRFSKLVDKYSAWQDSLNQKAEEAREEAAGAATNHSRLLREIHVARITRLESEGQSAAQRQIQAEVRNSASCGSLFVYAVCTCGCLYVGYVCAFG
eukprot:GCRY01002701.1.p1 GENE.GCRY01002701.1~~GCRY01002701.1.p1  ORF type:complete len:399 (-),score=38.00 GCRY01002701.1:42-1238(-)